MYIRNITINSIFQRIFIDMIGKKYKKLLIIYFEFINQSLENILK